MEVILKKSYKAKAEGSSGPEWLSPGDTVDVDEQEYDRLFALDYCERAARPREPVSEAPAGQTASTRKTATRRK